MGLGSYVVKDVMREIGNRPKEFFEFVLPPVDVVMQNDNLVVTIDMPGFEKNSIKLRIHGHILSVNARRETVEDGSVIWRQRPNVNDKKIWLPMRVKDEEDLGASAKYTDGVLSLTIPIKGGKTIKIEKLAVLYCNSSSHDYCRAYHSNLTNQLACSIEYCRSHKNCSSQDASRKKNVS